MAAAPRLKSRTWVEAFLRTCQTVGKYGAVLHAGHDDAGAVFVVINNLNGRHSLLGPPPGEAVSENGDRRFELRGSGLDWLEVSEKLQALRRVDSDVWVVEVEDRAGLAGLVPETA